MLILFLHLVSSPTVLVSLVAPHLASAESCPVRLNLLASPPFMPSIPELTKERICAPTSKLIGKLWRFGSSRRISADQCQSISCSCRSVVVVAVRTDDSQVTSTIADRIHTLPDVFDHPHCFFIRQFPPICVWLCCNFG